ncbi:SRPBCC family protein [Nakamurella silvestris]|nr:SRPBCC family protein [Nakamurella silvestris]
MSRVSVTASVDVDAAPEVAFAEMADAAGQGRWILATETFPVDGAVPCPEVGSRLVAFTGLLGVGFLDLMTVTEYDPPRRWVVSHHGKVVKGDGVFTVDARGTGSTVSWTELVDLPLGLLGRFGWIFVKPAVRWGLGASLRRLGRVLK